MSSFANIDLGNWGKIIEIVGSLTNVGGQIYGGITESQAAEENKKRAQELAVAATDKAAYEAELKRSEGRRLIATQRAGYAKSGVQLAGSPLAVMSQTMSDIEKDALMIEKGGQVEAGGYQSEAKLYKKRATSELWGGIISGGGSLLTSAGSWLKPTKPLTTFVKDTIGAWG
jgi:hypothetical protein